MPDLDLGKQIGPLPLGAWIAVVAGGLGIALYSRNNGEVSPYVVEDTGGTRLDPVGDGSVGGWTQTGPAAPTTTGIPLDNDAWARKAIEYLIGQGYNPSDSYAAITGCLSGEVTVSGYALWGAAIRGIGPPPFPVLVLPPISVPSVTPETVTPGGDQAYEEPYVAPYVPPTPAPPPPPPPPPPSGSYGVLVSVGVPPPDRPHRWERTGPNNQHCKICGRWRDTWVHTNRG